jgi:hypothetical protein
VVEELAMAKIVECLSNREGVAEGWLSSSFKN